MIYNNEQVKQPEQIGEVIKKKKKGGAMPGAGRPKGRMNNSSLDAMAVKKEYLTKIRRNASRLFNAQMSLAEGTQMLFVVHTDSKGKRSKPELVTDPDLISRFIDEREGLDGVMEQEGGHMDYFFLTTKLPDSRTISDMLDRAFGKAEATLDVTSGGDKINPISQLTVEELRKLVKG